MKLLILTQKIDKNDSVLGFFHAWVVEFAKHCEKITVICLEKGRYDFPENVKVLSLGKEDGQSRAKYIFRFFIYIWSERKRYDTVFVHMNQEYILLGGIFWKLFRKKIWLWRNHPVGSFRTDIAVFWSDKVFCTSKYSYTARFKKTKLMPAGIDTEIFKRNSEIPKEKNSILFLGRISAVKNPLAFIDALYFLRKKGVYFYASVIGDVSEKDTELYKKVRQKIADYQLDEMVNFQKGIPNGKTAEMYNRHEIYVNLTPSGSMDKTILEAMSSEAMVIVANQTFRGILPDNFLCGEKNSEELAEKLKQTFTLSETEKETCGKTNRKYAQKHSLLHLTDKLFSA
jgi:glycosyltransferase involved in cell wall biosynthesis